MGFPCDSLRQSFLLSPEKKTKFAALRESILSFPLVSLKTLQRFAGKVISFSLAIPGCKLYVREVFSTINSKVDFHSDNLTLKADLDNFGCKSSSVNESVKEILECGHRYNLAINVHYVPSRDIWQAVRRGYVPTSAARCPRKLGILWSDILVRTPLISCLWTVTIGEIVSAGFCPTFSRGQLQLFKGLCLRTAHPGGAQHLRLSTFCLGRATLQVFFGSKVLWSLYSSGPGLAPPAPLVGCSSICCSRSTFAQQERRRNRVAFPVMLCA